MKKFWITLLSVLMIVTCVAFAAGCDSCGKQDDVLSTYILDVSGKLVEKDFVLPATVKDHEVEWSSDNAAIAVEKRTDDWLAKVTLGDSQTNVNLTVKCGKEEKKFEVTVAAFDISYFTDNFVFEQNKSTVYETFDLPTSHTINGKTATITWSVDRPEDKGYIAIVDGGKTGKQCQVTESSLNPEVKIFATFSYNGKTSKVPYRMTVSFKRGHTEEVDYWYNNTGVSITLSGYVVEIATGYSEQYNNVSLYMVDDDFCSGYYLYRVKLKTADESSLVKPGAHITVTGSTNTVYNGLYETNSDGTLVVDKDKSMSEADLATKVAKLDDKVLAGDPAAIYHTSRLVSLEKWTVKSVSAAPEAGKATTLLTLTKDNVDVAIGVTKYLEGAYSAAATDATWTALSKLRENIAVGDVVSVKGILGYYKGYQILPLKAEDVVKETVAATEANANLKKIGAACKAVKDTLTKNAGYIVVADKEFAVDTVKDGVTISYEVLRNSTSVSFADGKLKITAGAEDKAVVKVTYILKDGETEVYKTYTFHEIHSKKMTDEQVASTVQFNLELSETETATGFSLPVEVNEYPGATISWALKAAVDGVTVADGKLTIVPSTTTERNITLVATVTYGTATADPKEIDVKVIKVDPVATGTFVMVADASASELKSKLYFTGEFNAGGYAITSDSPYDAVQVVVAEADGGFTLKIGEKYLELDSNHKIVLSDSKTAVWAYDYVLKVFTWDVKDYGVCVIGTYTNNDTKKTNSTLGASKVSYISGDNASKIGKTQFPVGFEKPTEDKRTDAEKAADALKKVDKLTVSKAGDFNLPVSKVTGVTFSWEVKEGTATVSGSTLNIAALPTDADATVKLTLTATCNDAHPTKEIIVTVKKAESPYDHAGTAADPHSTADVVKIFATLEANKTYQVDGADKEIYVKGYVTVAGEINGNYGLKNVYIADVAGTAQADSVLVYNTNWGEAVLKHSENPLKVGDLIVVRGYVKNYTDKSGVSTNEIANSGSKYPAITVWQRPNDTRTDAEKAAAALEKVAATMEIKSIGNTVLESSYEPAVTFAWTIKSGNAATLDGNKLTVAALPSADATVVLTVTATCNDAHPTKDVTVTVKAPVAAGASATFNFSGVETKSGEISAQDALDLLQSVGGDACGLTGVTAISKVYKGDSNINDKCLKFGTSSANGTLTLTFSKNVSKVVINCKGWKNTDKISVNDIDGGTLVAKEGTASDKEFVLTTASDTITIGSNKRVIVVSITVYFAD